MMKVPGNIMCSYRTLLLIAFMEGIAVLGVELLSAKMIAPYYGTSIYVWTAVFAVTLAGLASGYFVGGILSRAKDKVKWLYTVLFLATVSIALMPFVGSFLLKATLGLNLKLGITTSILFLIFLPLSLLGMTSPIIIRILSETRSEIGLRSGTVYAISTLGGFLATLAFPFVLMPWLGVRESTVLLSLTLLCFPAIYWLRRFSAR